MNARAASGAVTRQQVRALFGAEDEVAHRPDQQDEQRDQPAERIHGRRADARHQPVGELLAAGVGRQAVAVGPGEVREVLGQGPGAIALPPLLGRATADDRVGIGDRLDRWQVAATARESDDRAKPEWRLHEPTRRVGQAWAAPLAGGVVGVDGFGIILGVIGPGAISRGAPGRPRSSAAPAGWADRPAGAFCHLLRRLVGRRLV